MGRETWETRAQEGSDPTHPCKVQLCGGKAWQEQGRMKTGQASIWKEEEPGKLPEKEEPRSGGEQGPRSG